MLKKKATRGHATPFLPYSICKDILAFRFALIKKAYEEGMRGIIHF